MLLLRIILEYWRGNLSGYTYVDIVYLIDVLDQLVTHCVISSCIRHEIIHVA